MASSSALHQNIGMHTPPSSEPLHQDLQAILNNMPAMIGYWDRHGINRFGNDAYRVWFGIDPTSMPGRHIREVIGEERYRLNLPYIERALAGESQTFERTIPLPDGQIRHSLANYIPDVVAGEVQGFYVLVTDITPLKTAEAALRASEERYRAVVEDQTEVISRFRPDGSLIFVNEVYCRLFGKTDTDLLAGTWMPQAHPDDLSLITAQLARLSPATPVVVIENRVYSGQGALLWMQFVNRGFFNQAGELQEIQSVGRDITERKLAQQALEESRHQLEQRVQERTEQLRQLSLQLTCAEERERQAVARYLHDELGQTLHVLKLKLGLLRQDDEQAALLQDLAALLADASRQVRTLTSQLSPPVLLSLGLGPALRWLCDEMAERYRLTVTCELAEGPLPLSPAHAAILFRAARELLINVTKHATTDRASLTLHRSPTQLSLTVADPGCGFRQLDAARSGTLGFGLASVRERIGFLGGSTQIDSEPGQGSRITLTIPLTEEPRS